jgi:hypothetical protein
MEKYSASLAIRQMQIKKTLRFHLAQIRITIIKEKDNKCWTGCRKKEQLYTVVEMHVRTAIMEISVEFP